MVYPESAPDAMPNIMWNAVLNAPKDATKPLDILNVDSNYGRGRIYWL